MSSRTQSEDSLDSAIPPWKRELILRRRALLARTHGGIPTPGSGGALNSAAASLLVAGHSGAVKTAAAAFSAISGESIRRSPESRAGGSGVKCVAMKLEGLECDAVSISRMNGGKEGQAAAAVADGAHPSKSRSKPPSGDVKRPGVGRAGTRRKSSKGSVTTPDEDDDEELRYGPGIVNRLRSKYLSMTLRESQTKGLRPPLSSMRRAASLEDILDGPGQQTPKDCHAAENKPTVIKVGRYNKRTGVVSTRPTLHLPPESLKRARSVETLLKSPVSGLLSPTLAKEDVIIIEGNKEVVADSDGRRVKHSGVVEEELPPPDVVRQTLKIFEYSSPPTSPGGKKSTRTTNGVATSSLIVRATPAVAIPPPSPPHGPKPQLSPKPVILQMSSAKTNVASSVKVTPQKVGPESPQKMVKQSSDTRPPVLPTAAKTSPTSLLPAMSKPPAIAPPPQAPAKKTSPTKPFKTPLNKPQPKSSPTETKPPSPLPDAVLPNGQMGLESADTRAVSRAALENIRKDGLSIEFKFDGVQKPKSHLPGSSSLTQGAESVPRQVGIIRPMTKPPTAPGSTARRATPPRSIAPLQSTSSAAPDVVKSALTEREKEKNHINRVKSTEAPTRKVFTTPPQLVSPPAGATKLVTVVKEVPSLSKVEPAKVTPVKKPSEDTTETQPIKTGLWDSRSRWNEQQNSVIFSFKDRPTVPDYIENDGMIIKSRERPRRNEPGSVWLRDSSRGESSDDIDDDDEDVADVHGWVSSDPPPPCNVHFEGGNILINGRSNLRKNILAGVPAAVAAATNSSAGGARKLRITFNDEATRTFEYPSESSYLDDSPTATSPNVMPGTSSSSSSTHPPPPSTSAPTPSLAPSAGGSLASYTPSKIQIGEDFQLGITRTIPQPSSSHSLSSTDTSKEDRAAEEEQEYLKPTEEGVTWNAETAADLLF